MWRYLPKQLFFALIVKPFILFLLGLDVANRERLPGSGPAIIAANHNSHLDTLVLMSLFPLKVLPHVRPVAAADYFLRNRFLAWFSLVLIGIIPIHRGGNIARDELFADCKAALERGDILILFPEGTRGVPEKLGALKKGVYHLACMSLNVLVTPVYLHGLGKALPKGEALLVPFNVKVSIGNAISMSGGEPTTSMSTLEQRLRELARECGASVERES